MLESIRTLRAIAALLVVYFHTQDMINSKVYPDYFSTGIGAVGVDIFFVISGFIMYYTSKDSFQNGESLKFLKNRAIRVIPAYYLFTTIMVMLLVALPQLFGNLHFELDHVISSYLFIFSENNEGVVGTVLGVGWTLVFEVFFYGLFAVMLMFNKKFFFPGITLIFLLGNVIGLIFSTAPAWTTVFSSPIVFEFLFGCIVGYLYLKINKLNLISSVTFILLGMFGVIYFTFNNYVGDYLGWARVWTLGIPSALLVYGMLQFERNIKIITPRLVKEVGNSSYSLYLIHSFILSGFGTLVAPILYKQGFSVILIVVIALSLCIFGGWISFKFFELPATRFLKNISKKKIIETDVVTDVVTIKENDLK